MLQASNAVHGIIGSHVGSSIGVYTVTVITKARKRGSARLATQIFDRLSNPASS
jgi:hypothetical protein